MSAVGYIAVHGGAGTHGTRNEKEVKSALRKACSEGLSSLSASASPANLDTEAPLGTSALLMVEQAVVVLENEVHLNAGILPTLLQFLLFSMSHEPGIISSTQVIFLMISIIIYDSRLWLESHHRRHSRV
ncbi:hypothetical protein BJ912DRAFT_946722 [Pholiota molesta]|nr:hypothetical protein BJ912DRAFT_946722 [Pholiota molesta]